MMDALHPFLLLHCPEALPYRQQVDAPMYRAFFEAYRQTVEAPLQAVLQDSLKPYLYFKEWLIYDLKTTDALTAVYTGLRQSRQMLLDQHSSFQQQFGIQPRLQAALDAGAAAPMGAFYHSAVPERLPQLLPIASHYQCWLVVGELAQPHLQNVQLDYLTRTYFEGTALEIWGQPEG